MKSLSCISTHRKKKQNDTSYHAIPSVKWQMNDILSMKSHNDISENETDDNHVSEHENDDNQVMHCLRVNTTEG